MKHLMPCFGMIPFILLFFWEPPALLLLPLCSQHCLLFSVFQPTSGQAASTFLCALKIIPQEWRLQKHSLTGTI